MNRFQYWIINHIGWFITLTTITAMVLAGGIGGLWSFIVPGDAATVLAMFTGFIVGSGTVVVATGRFDAWERRARLEQRAAFDGFYDEWASR